MEKMTRILIVHRVRVSSENARDEYARFLAKFTTQSNLILPCRVLDSPNTMRGELLHEFGGASSSILLVLVVKLLLQLLRKADVGWRCIISFTKRIV